MSSSLASRKVPKLLSILCKRLSKKHIRELRRSGLSDEVILQSGFYTESNTEKIQRSLNWSFSGQLESMGPFLAIPYYDLNGERTAYTRFKPDHPRSNTDKDTDERKIVKYEAPKGEPTRPYLPRQIKSIFYDSSVPLMITEGEKKALKATQEGFPCVGLPGVSNWSTPSKQTNGPRKERELHNLLAKIPWQERHVIIVFDTDASRNPNVNREAAELARALERQGAIVTIVTLPTCWNEEKKQFEKQGLDDYLVRHSPDNLAQLIHEASGTRETVSWRVYRELMQEAYARPHPSGKYYVNTAPTGMGKTWSDVECCRWRGNSLILAPTHDQIDDIVEIGYQHGLFIATYPKRCRENCQRAEECCRVQLMGFNPSEIVCPECIKQTKAESQENKRPFRPCEYYQQRERTNHSNRIGATHQRLQLIGRSQVDKKGYISIQEDAIDVIVPLKKVQTDFRKLMEFFEWVNFCLPVGANFEKLDLFMWCIGNLEDICKEYKREIFQIQKDIGNDYSFKRTSAFIYAMYDSYIEMGDDGKHRYISFMKPEPIPPDVPESLKHRFKSDLIQFFQHLLCDRISRMYVRHYDEEKRTAELAYILKTEFPEDAMVMFSDATLDRQLLPLEFRDRIVDMAPDAVPEPDHRRTLGR